MVPNWGAAAVRLVVVFYQAYGGPPQAPKQFRSESLFQFIWNKKIADHFNLIDNFFSVFSFFI